MRGKVKNVRRSQWYSENSADHWSSNSHAVRHTNTYAELYDGTCVDIDEDDIRDFYEVRNLTRDVIDDLNDDLHNEYINYYADEDGDYCLDGDLSDYISEY